MISAALISKADWLSAERVRRFALVFSAFALLLLGADAWMHTRAGLTDLDGIQLGRDFVNYWSGAKLAASGHASTVYNLDGFAAFERSQTAPNAALKWYSYPPVALLLTLPLSLTSFAAGLVAWLGIGYILNAALMTPSLSFRWSALIAFSTPASLMNALSGQNGAFSAALLAGGILLLESKPWLAGTLLGMLCFKPQLAVLVPLALVVGGHGRAFIAAILSVAIICALTLLLFGSATWIAFFHNAPINVWVLETGTGFWPRMPTPFATFMQLGLGLHVAFAVQIASALLAAASVAIVWRGNAPMSVKGAVLIFAGFLTTPYAWDYDLVAVTFAVIWLAAAGRATGFLSFEKCALASVIALPLLDMPFQALLHVQLGFLFLWAALIVAVRRALNSHNGTVELRPA